jgi:3-deoxy-manno-octulosonate cytidylyltransferase (CMP-KDO synthetase)
MPAIVVIPARFESTRFPGKALADLEGKPLIQHVYENSERSSLAHRVVVATDSEEIMEAVKRFGGSAVMTSPKHPSGTDRIAEVAAGLDYDIIVNVQGDEPLIRPDIIDAAIGLLDDGRAAIGTLASEIKEPSEITDPNVVKVVFDTEGFALYFSRAPIPHHRQMLEGLLYKHIGIYSYRSDALRKMTAIRTARLELAERLEQLRALENGMRINIGITDYETVGVDTPEDLERARRCLSSSS